MKGYATPLLANFFEQTRNSSKLKWVYRFLLPTPNMTRKPMPFICPQDGIRICGNLCLRLFLIWILLRITQTSRFLEKEMFTLWSHLLKVVFGPQTSKL